MLMGDVFDILCRRVYEKKLLYSVHDLRCYRVEQTGMVLENILIYYIVSNV